MPQIINQTHVPVGNEQALIYNKYTHQRHEYTIKCSLREEILRGWFQNGVHS